MPVSLAEIKSKLISDERFRIVFLGDSLTSTEWVHPNWRGIIEYVIKEELVKKMGDWKPSSWGVRGINSGLDGATSRDLLERLNSDVFVYSPQMVICSVGINDIYFNISPEEHQKNVKKLLQEMSSKIEQVVFCTSLFTAHEPSNRKYAEYVEADKAILPMKGVRFVNLFEKYQKFDLVRFFTFVSGGNEVVGIKPGEIDYLHPNQLGNAYVAKVILADAFGVEFDPEVYIQDCQDEAVQYPRY